MLDRWYLPLVAAAFVALACAPSYAELTEEEPAAAASSADDAHSDEAHDDHSHGDDAHGGHDEGEHGEAAPDPLATDPDLAIWTLVIFLLMLAILSQTAWKPIMEGLKAREDGITGKLAEAEAVHEKAKALLAEHETKLAGAADQVRELLEEARRDADATIAQAKADAKSEFEAERARAARDIEQARDAAIRELAENTAGLAIDLAGRVVGQEISSRRQGELVSEALDRFKSSSPN